MKIDKNTTNAYACYEKYSKCILCKNHTRFYNPSVKLYLAKLYSKSHL